MSRLFMLGLVLTLALSTPLADQEPSPGVTPAGPTVTPQPTANDLTPTSEMPPGVTPIGPTLTPNPTPIGPDPTSQTPPLGATPTEWATPVRPVTGAIVCLPLIFR